MKTLSLTSLLTILLSFSISLAKAQETSTITDVDGNVYETVRIGNQIWMAENLKVSRYNDGSEIQHVPDSSSWTVLTSGAWVNYSNDASNDEVYGKLYNWYAVWDSRGICPVGWRVARGEDWDQITNFLGGTSSAGGKLKVTGNEFWESPNAGASNESGFSALPGGFRSQTGGFLNIGRIARFWSSSGATVNTSWNRDLYHNSTNISNYATRTDMKAGLSVRCINNQEVPAITPSITSNEVSSITSNSAVFSSTVIYDGSSPIISSGAVWSTSQNPTLESNIGNVNAAVAGQGTYTVQSAGLTASTQYYIRGYAINAAGITYSDPISFTTLSESNPTPTNLPKITTSDPFRVSSTSAVAGGEVVADGGRVVTSRGVVWSTTKNPTLELNDGIMLDASEGLGIFEVSLLHLSPSSRYYFRAFATNSSGTGYGNEISFISQSNAPIDTVSDIDGNLYETVLIGNQRWMKENLKVGRYRDGSEIPKVMQDSVWKSQKTGAWVHYGNNSSYDDIYGKLYNWYAVRDNRGLCPEGWTVPSAQDWTQLESYFGGTLEAGRKMKVAGTQYWQPPNTGATNDSDFSALPSGFRGFDGIFYDIRYTTRFWSSTGQTVNTATYRGLRYNVADLSNYFQRDDFRAGFSVRCLSNQPAQVTLPILTTEEVSSVTTSSAISGGNITSDGGTPVTVRGLVWSTSQYPTLEINDGITSDSQSGLGSFKTDIGNLSPGTMYYVRAYASNSTGAGYGNQVKFTTEGSSRADFYLDENGVTVKCEDAQVGDSGIVNGIMYTKRDRKGLDSLRAIDSNHPDFSTTCTSGITDMYALFTRTQFNQPIGHWDVSSVTKMGKMLSISPFNQDISEWDVSNVEGMAEMFDTTPFNKPIGEWNVSKVRRMDSMFLNNNQFNQDISKWDVSNVEYMGRMFRASSSFNQDISSWDVSKVINMFEMFAFAGSFNQDIGKWDVSNVKNMNGMLHRTSSFNQSLVQWCVSNIPSEPAEFSTGSALTVENKPKWGTCPISDSSKVTDIDGNEYATVQIGNQLWMAENLKTTRYRDGSQIPNVTEDLSWAELSTGAWAIYGNTASNDTIYGKLYNGFVALDPRGICPTGWHVPTDAEWTILSNYLGGESVAGGKMKATGTQYWQSPNTGATNVSGFTGLPAGSRPISESFSGLGYEAGFWSSTKYGNQNRSWTRYLGHDKAFLGRVDIGYNHGFSIRCVKDAQNPPPSPPTDDPDTFTATLTVSNASGNTIDLIFGQRSDATAGYDASLDQLAPPRPPTGTFDARFIRDSEEYYTDMQPSADTLASWRLMFSAGTGGYPVTVRWDSTQLHDLSTDFYLRDAIDGSYINVRMTVADSVVISQSFITELQIVRVPFNAQTQITQNYSQGWNLVGLPVDMAHNSYMDLYPTAYSNSLFGFSQAYELRQQLITGQGYWVRLTQAADVTYSGTSISSITRTLLSGWNLVSGPSTEMSVSSIGDPSGILSTSPVYGFSGSYTQATSLEPGRGYWIRANAGGDIVLGARSKTLANSKALSSTQEYSQLHRLEVFTQLAGSEHMTQTGQIGEFKGRFYFNPERISLPREASLAELPPVPPAGIFDVRLEGDRLVSESSIAELRLRPAGQVVWIRVSPPFRDQDAGATPPMPDLYRVKEYQGTIARGSSQRIAGQLHEIQSGVDRIVVEYLGKNLPESFHLEQNYPNPFNPTTQIRFALPEASDVRLEVYNLTGQRVAILAQGLKQAGWHQVELDGSGLASGVYVYRLSTSQGFTQSKRLMLVK